MSIYTYQSIPKMEVAIFFLDQALDFYNKDEKFYYLQAINAAGITEEILGAYVKKQGKDNALSLEISDLPPKKWT